MGGPTFIYSRASEGHGLAIIKSQATNADINV